MPLHKQFWPYEAFHQTLSHYSPNILWDNILFPILFVLRVLLGGSRFVEVPDFLSFQLQFFFEFCIRFLIVFIWPYTKKS